MWQVSYITDLQSGQSAKHLWREVREGRASRWSFIHLQSHLSLGQARSPLVLSLMREGNLFHQNQQYFWINIFISTQVIIWKFLSLASSIIAVMMLWNNQENECWIYIRIIYHIYQQGCKDYIVIESFHFPHVTHLLVKTYYKFGETCVPCLSSPQGGSINSY